MKQKYKINEDFFEKIDTENKAYWLGFIWCDGNITTHKNTGSKTLSIGLQIGDINHLNKFAQDIETDYPIKPHSNQGYESIRISIHNRKIFNDLQKLGLKERKSLIQNYPSFIKVLLLKNTSYAV